jgi:hypothetical protein
MLVTEFQAVEKELFRKCMLLAKLHDLETNMHKKLNVYLMTEKTSYPKYFNLFESIYSG